MIHVTDAALAGDVCLKKQRNVGGKALRCSGVELNHSKNVFFSSNCTYIYTYCIGTHHRYSSSK